MVEAGQRLFLRDGLRGASMEAIAREAGVAKATLYSYFPDKEAVFAAVVERIVIELRRLSEAALADDGPVWRRVADALATKHKTVFRLLEGSPHAAELYECRPAGAAVHLGDFDAWLEGQIVRLIGQSGHDEPVRYAYLLIAAADGIARRARRAEEIGPAVRLIAEKLLS